MSPLPDAPVQLTLSIVSHGQGLLIRHLLGDLRRPPGVSFEILLTLNIPEDESFLAGFEDLPIRVLRNASVKGFGANHNAAFAASTAPAFAIVNPDIRFPAGDLSVLLAVFADARVGACGPTIVSDTAKSPGWSNVTRSSHPVRTRCFFAASSSAFFRSASSFAALMVRGSLGPSFGGLPHSGTGR